MRSNFYICHDKFQDLSDKELDYFIKSFKYGYESDEWQICRLRQRIINKEALRYLNMANKEING